MSLCASAGITVKQLAIETSGSHHVWLAAPLPHALQPSPSSSGPLGLQCTTHRRNGERVERRPAAVRCEGFSVEVWRRLPPVSGQPHAASIGLVRSASLKCAVGPTPPPPRPPAPACSAVCPAAVLRCLRHASVQVSEPQRACASAGLLPPPPPPLCSPPLCSSALCRCGLTAQALCTWSRRVIPRSKLEAVSQHGLGYAWASFWLPAWGDCCIADPAASPVGEMRLVPDVAGVWPLFQWLMPRHAV